MPTMPACLTPSKPFSKSTKKCRYSGYGEGAVKILRYSIENEEEGRGTEEKRWGKEKEGGGRKKSEGEERSVEGKEEVGGERKKRDGEER